MNFEYLSSPLTDDEVEWKVQTCGKTPNGFWCLIVPYIQARAAMDRFDKAFGPLNWKVNYSFLSEGVVCHLSVYDLEKKEWVTKEDGAERTDIEPFKGGMSSALKRAAVAYGIGRELYSFDKVFGKIVDRNTHGAQRATTKDKEEFFFLAPKLAEIQNNNVTKEKSLTTKGVSTPIRKDQSNNNKPTEQDRKALTELAFANNWSREWVLGELKRRYNVATTAELTKEQFNEFQELIRNNPQAKKEETK